jgi:hypothetical protein
VQHLGVVKYCNQKTVVILVLRATIQVQEDSAVVFSNSELRQTDVKVISGYGK